MQLGETCSFRNSWHVGGIVLFDMPLKSFFEQIERQYKSLWAAFAVVKLGETLFDFVTIGTSMVLL